jgi:hypothetical protein
MNKNLASHHSQKPPALAVNFDTTQGGCSHDASQINYNVTESFSHLIKILDSHDALLTLSFSIPLQVDYPPVHNS